MAIVDMVFLFSTLVAYKSQKMHSCDIHNIDTSPIQYTPVTYITSDQTNSSAPDQQNPVQPTRELQHAPSF